MRVRRYRQALCDKRFERFIECINEYYAILKKNIYVYMYIYHTWKKLGIQRRKNVNNDARMKGKCPNILRNYESYKLKM